MKMSRNDDGKIFGTRDVDGFSLREQGNSWYYWNPYCYGVQCNRGFENFCFSLSLADKPIFSTIEPYELIGMEGEPFVISVSAMGNPNEIRYTWTRDGLPLVSNNRRISVRAATLNITKLDRHDAGTYICEATNDEGTTFYQLNLTVQCKYF